MATVGDCLPTDQGGAVLGVGGGRGTGNPGKPQNWRSEGHLARHATTPRNDGDDDGGGVGSDDGVVMTVAMKLRDEGEDGGQLR